MTKILTAAALVALTTVSFAADKHQGTPSTETTQAAQGAGQGSEVYPQGGTQGQGSETNYEAGSGEGTSSKEAK